MCKDMNISKDELTKVLSIVLKMIDALLICFAEITVLYGFE